MVLNYQVAVWVVMSALVALLVGSLVAFGIHLAHRWREEHPKSPQ